MSRYVQAVIVPESGPQAVAGLERVQQKIGGEPLSVDLVDRLVAGKVYNFGAATKFEASDENTSNRVVLAGELLQPGEPDALPGQSNADKDVFSNARISCASALTGMDPRSLTGRDPRGAQDLVM